MRFAHLTQHRRVRQAMTLLLITGALICMFPPHNKLFQWLGEHTAWVSLLYLGFGMSLLLLSRTRLMFVCLGCSAVVSFYANEMALRRHDPNAIAQPTLKFTCLYHPNIQPQEAVGILLERGTDAVLLAGKPGETDSALLGALLRHWPNHIAAPVNPDDSLRLNFYTRLPLVESSDSLIIDSLGGFWVRLRPEFAKENLWVYVAGEEVRSPKSEVLPSDASLRTSDSGLRTPAGPVVAIGQQYNTSLLVRAGAAGWRDSYLCQKNDERGVKYPFSFRIYHNDDFDCEQSEMLRFANRDYLGLETMLRLKDGYEKPN